MSHFFGVYQPYLRLCGADYTSTNCEMGGPTVATGSCETCTSSSQCMGSTCDHNRFNDDDIQNNGCEMWGPTVAFELCEA